MATVIKVLEIRKMCLKQFCKMLGISYFGLFFFYSETNKICMSFLPEWA